MNKTTDSTTDGREYTPDAWRESHGWICPRCGRGMAPWARDCPCYREAYYPYHFYPVYPTVPIIPTVPLETDWYCGDEIPQRTTTTSSATSLKKMW